MGCLLALFAIVSPRLAIFLVWLFSNRIAVAIHSGWLALLGFLFLPWTTLAWVIAYEPVKGVSGFGWFLVILAFLFDLSSLFGGDRARRGLRRAEQ